MSTVNMPGFTADLSLHHPRLAYPVPRMNEFEEPRSGLVHPARYACWSGGCACAGDEDCNGMFSNACGSGYAQCWVRGSGPGGGNVFCLCAR